MEWEVLNIYTDDAYGVSSFDGYQLYGFADGYLGDSNFLNAERYVDLKEYLISVESAAALQSKLDNYINTEWIGVSDPVEFEASMRQRMNLFNQLVEIIEETD